MFYDDCYQPDVVVVQTEKKIKHWVEFPCLIVGINRKHCLSNTTHVHTNTEQCVAFGKFFAFRREKGPAIGRKKAIPRSTFEFTNDLEGQTLEDYFFVRSLGRIVGCKRAENLLKIVTYRRDIGKLWEQRKQTQVDCICLLNVEQDNKIHISIILKGKT